MNNLAFAISYDELEKIEQKEGYPIEYYEEIEYLVYDLKTKLFQSHFYEFHYGISCNADQVYFLISISEKYDNLDFFFSSFPEEGSLDIAGWSVDQVEEIKKYYTKDHLIIKDVLYFFEYDEFLDILKKRVCTISYEDLKTYLDLGSR